MTILICLMTVNISAVDFKNLLKQADGLVNYPGHDFSGEYTIVQVKPGQTPTTTIAAVFRRDSIETYVILIKEPSINKGQGYLKQKNTLWFFDPESRKFNSTSSSDRFQNTNARNSDFTQSTLALDYDVVSGTEGMLGRYDCWILNLEANNDEVTYPKMKLWISKDGLVRKSEDYSLSGQLLRTTAIPDYYKLGDVFVPKRILFVDALRGARIDGKFQNEKTQITIDKPSLNDLPDSVFSKSFLESMNR
ncbi:outer membrane lipoprotein-sorting protein [Oceanispirochaeta crateris]|uniref:Outer membrane lipoprotein-sorting protein n=2 Tax=Oceanispirochaeta crateris TaxID=2518645 RepID=A0A5C1QQQ6_9SPIO|nr:outer membrane lipoprotein-sorting protein [Oceanispirochaeta crateris]